MDKPTGHYSNWNKLKTRKNTACSHFVWNLKKVHYVGTENNNSSLPAAGLGWWRWGDIGQRT
jgi:hypothetical protein